VKSRLARAEELGLIEVLPGERGPWGTTANQYRLRWANDGRAATRTFRAVMHKAVLAAFAQFDADPATCIGRWAWEDPPSGMATWLLSIVGAWASKAW
jgi:hypothetical protein